LVREGSRNAFAHLHPIRKRGLVFEVAVPPLPEGRYAIFCDLTFEGGVGSTATNSIELPSRPALNDPAGPAVERDPDDSWSSYPDDSVPAAATASPVCRLPAGKQVMWNAQKPLRVEQDAALRFSVTDAAGNPV